MADSKKVDGWLLGTNGGAPCVYDPRGGFVAFNEDMSALYTADSRMSEIPFSVIDALRKAGDAESRDAGIEELRALSPSKKKASKRHG